MKLRLIGLLIWFGFSNAWGQNNPSIIQGTVKDSLTNERLERVIIQLSDSIDGAVISYDITDLEGKFELKNPILQGFATANLLGYHSKSIAIDSNTTHIEFSLSDLAYKLEEVSVKAFKSGFIKNGDTIVYKPEVFLNGTETNLHDVLNRLPGVDVLQNGEITVNGKKVDKLQLEGSDFMNANRNAALLGISASNIADIEHYTQAEWQGETSILNIHLNSDAKNKMEGNVRGGAGFVKKATIESNLYRIGERTNVFFRFKINNIEQDPVSLADFYQLNGGMFHFLKSIESKKNTIPSIFLNQEKHKQQQFLIPSFNFSHKINATSTLSGYLLNINGQAKEQQNSELLQSENFNLTSQNAKLLHYRGVFGKIEYQAKPDKKSNLTLSYISNHFYQKEDNKGIDILQNTLNNFTLKSNERTNKQAIFLNYNRILNFWGLVLNTNFGTTRNFNDLQNTLSNEPSILWSEFVLNQKLNTANLNLKTQNNTAFIDINLKKKWANFQNTLSANYNFDKLNINTVLENTNGQINRQTNNLGISNHLKYHLGRLSLGLLSQVQLYHINTLQTANKVFYPQKFSITYNLPGAIQMLNLSFSTQQSLSNVDLPYNFTAFQNTNIIEKNLVSPFNFKHNKSVSLFYYKLSILHNRTIFMMANYGFSDKIAGTNTQNLPNFQLITNQITNNKQFFAHFGYEEKIGKFKSAISVKSTINSIIQTLYIEGFELSRTTQNASINIAYNSLFKKAFNVETTLNINYFGLFFLQSNSKNIDYSLTIKPSYLKNGYKLEVEYELFFQKINQEYRNTHYVNFIASKKIHSKWSCFTECRHLLQLNKDVQKSLVNNQFNQTQQITYFNFPGYCIFGLEYFF